MLEKNDLKLIKIGYLLDVKICLFLLIFCIIEFLVVFQMLKFSYFCILDFLAVFSDVK